MCEMVDPSTSRSARVACAANIKTKNCRENSKKRYEGQVEDPYQVEILQVTREPIQHNEQVHSQVGVQEARNKMQ